MNSKYTFEKIISAFLVVIGFTTTYMFNRITSDISEVKADVKKLLEASATNSARITALERIVYNNHDVVSTSLPSKNQKEIPSVYEMVAILRDEETNPNKYETLN